jgi:hypothetical protein
MELLSVIRRWHYRDHFSIREISRRTGLSRNTVRKYLRSDTVEPKFAVPDRPPKSVISLTGQTKRSRCGGGQRRAVAGSNAKTQVGVVTLSKRRREAALLCGTSSGRDDLAPRGHRRGAKHTVRLS